MKAGRKTESKVDALPAWECFVMDDSELDETQEGQQMFFELPEDYVPASVPVRLTFTTEIRPLNLLRRRGRWCLSFLFKGHDGESPTMAIECGPGGPLSLEEAASLFYGGAPECARKSESGALEAR